MVVRNWRFIENSVKVGMRKELRKVLVADLRIKVVLGNADPLLYLKIRNGLEQYERVRTFWKRKREVTRGNLVK